MKNFNLVLFFLFGTFLIVSCETVYEKTFDTNDFIFPSEDDSDSDFYFLWVPDQGYLNLDQSIDHGSLIFSAKPFRSFEWWNPWADFDHYKALAMNKRPTPPGYPHNWVRTSASISCETYRGEDYDPFPEWAVTNPEDDPRLSSCGLSTVSLDTYIMANVMLTNHSLWALYGRLPYGRNDDDYYHAFLQIKKIGGRYTGEYHDVSIVYDSGDETLTWFVAGKPKLHVVSIGMPSTDPDVRFLTDFGGYPRIVKPTAFSSGFGLFNFLDGQDPNNPDSYTGLVEVTEQNPWTYYDQPYGFVYYDYEGNYYRLYDQGATLKLSSFKLETN